MMKKNQFWQYLVGAIAITLLMPTVASAHTGIGDPNGFWHGLGHPIGGGAIVTGAIYVLVNH